MLTTDLQRITEYIATLAPGDRIVVHSTMTIHVKVLAMLDDKAPPTLKSVRDQMIREAWNDLSSYGLRDYDPIIDIGQLTTYTPSSPAPPRMESEDATCRAMGLTGPEWRALPHEVQVKLRIHAAPQLLTEEE